MSNRERGGIVCGIRTVLMPFAAICAKSRSITARSWYSFLSWSGRKAPYVTEPVPARRLDVPLKFRAQPLRVVCEALAAAHGAQFEIDPAIDPRTTVSADLSGRNLKDALAVLAKATGLRVNRTGDGQYRVVPVAGGEPMAEKPIHEEPLAAGQEKP